MKFNWGTGIAIVYTVFALSMVGAVIASKQHDPGLVQKNYYDLDIHYQERLTAKQNAAILEGGLPIVYDAARQVVRIEFPTKLGSANGKVKLFRASTLADDVLLDIQTAADGAMEIPVAGKASGLWHMEVDWNAGGKTYFNETKITFTNTQ